MDLKVLSIIIVSYNTREILKNCLSSVLKETTNLNFEIIVIDNASSDGTIEMLLSEFTEVTIIENKTNKGFAAANNQGIEIAKGKYILLLNSDTVILNNAINKVYDFMEERKDVAIAGCKQLFPNLQLQPSCRSFPTLWNIFTEATFLYTIFKKTKLFGQYYLSYFKYDTIKKIDVVMGSFMFIRRKVFEDIGGFDEAFFFYTEETDFCYRAAQKGYDGYFFPEATIIHLGGGSPKNLLWTFENLHKSQLQFINKHYSGIEKLLMVILKRIGIALRIPVYFSFGLLKFDSFLMHKALVHLQLLFTNLVTKNDRK